VKQAGDGNAVADVFARLALGPVLHARHLRVRGGFGRARWPIDGFHEQRGPVPASRM